MGIGAFLRNPFVRVVPLVLVCGFAWHQYVSLNSHVLALPVRNILPNNSLLIDGRGAAPLGWTIAQAGQMGYKVNQEPGILALHTFGITVAHYQNGDLTITTPKATLASQKTYFYKGYYASRVTFDLLARYYYKDGSSKLVFLQEYGNSNNDWSTVSSAFNSGNTITAVQFMYKIASDGSLKLDSTYLEQKTTNLYVAPAIPFTTNLAPALNAQAQSPAPWSSFHGGDNSPSFSYVSNVSMPYLRIVSGNYKNGQAKWQYPSQSVMPGQRFAFQVTYQSSAPSEVVAEYDLQNGHRQFATLSSLLPADQWTKYATTFVVPGGARSMFVSVVLQANGYLNTGNYQLSNITQPGPLTFKRSLISITFDNGWQSAYTNGANLLWQFGMPGTFYIDPYTIDTINYMTTPELTALQSQGDEIGAQGYTQTDLTTLNDRALKSQFMQSRQFIAGQTGSTAINFAAPFGKIDPEVESYAKQYYRSERSTQNGLNTIQGFDPYDLKVLYIGNTTRLSTVSQALTSAESAHAWLILVYHQIGGNSRGASTISQNIFFKQLQLIKQSGITVKTVGSALNELETQ
jgi:peptidoglycan/xylan/chitin deacetylase (PgdA/CDA1 family)